MRFFPAVALLSACLVVGGIARADALGDARRQAAAGQPDVALATVEKALAAKPKDAELRFQRGVLLADLGRREAAMQAFTELNQEFPELPDPLNNLAVLYAAQGDLERARASLEAALRNQPGHRAARENLGDVYARLALRLWQSLAAGAQVEPTLARKLALARQLVSVQPASP